MVSDADLARALDRQREALLQVPGVTGAAVGRGLDGEPAICLYVLTGEAAEAAGARAHGLLPGLPVEMLVTGQPTAEE